MSGEKGQNQRSSESLAQQGPGGGFAATHAQGKAHAEQIVLQIQKLMIGEERLDISL